jgi:DNA polymerase-1
MRNHFPDLSGAKVICFDVETKDPNIKTKGAGWGRGDGHIIGLAVATDDGFKQYYPMRHEGYENHNPHDVLDWARIQLGRDNQPKLGHNIIYDLGWLEHEGVAVKGEINDTWTAAKLIDHGSSAALEEQGQQYLGEGKESLELYEWQWQAFGQGKPKSKKDLRENAMNNLYRCPPAMVGFYGESDVELPIRLFREQFQELQELGLWDVYRMECDLIPILVQMRLLGVSVDLDAAERARDHILDAANQLQKDVDKIAGRPVNTGSPVEMEKVFSRLKIPFNRTKNGKMSLTGAFLQTVQHPIGQMIVDLEELKKYNSAFIENAILGSNVNGRVHGQFNPLRAVTGRMSASNPNLQQVPSRNELAKMVRAIFIPDRGHHHWRKVDYSSVESRILAHFAIGQNASKLRKQYNTDPFTDYHQFTIDMVKRVTGIEIVRKHAKIINFGLCIAEGQLVLTNKGLVPIEKISTRHLLWDGVEWVRHEGVIKKGVKEVIEHQGLTATPDHKVWIADGTTRTLRQAKEENKILAKSQTACGEALSFPLQIDSLRHFESSRTIHGDDRVLLLQAKTPPKPVVAGKPPRSKVLLPEDKIQRQAECHPWKEILQHRTEVQQSETKGLPQLRGTRDTMRVSIGSALCRMGFRNLAHMLIQGTGVRQDRQRRKLFPHEPSTFNEVCKPDEHREVCGYGPCQNSKKESAQSSVCLVHDDPSDEVRSFGRRDCGEGKNETPHVREEPLLQKIVPVYDILNAGPRRRFTCSGVLVSNCYGASEKKLASMLGISLEEALPLFEAFHSGLPYVKATMSGASESVEVNGYSRTILGRRTNFDYWEPRYSPKGAPRLIPLKFDQAVQAYGPNIRRAHLHKAVNAIIQGSAADLMKSSMVQCHKKGLFDSVGFPRLVVHDELDWSIEEDVDEEAFKEILWTMENAIQFKVPIKVEAEWGPNWSQLYKL